MINPYFVIPVIKIKIFGSTLKFGCYPRLSNNHLYQKGNI